MFPSEQKLKPKCDFSSFTTIPLQVQAVHAKFSFSQNSHQVLFLENRSLHGSQKISIKKIGGHLELQENSSELVSKNYVWEFVAYSYDYV